MTRNPIRRTGLVLLSLLLPLSAQDEKELRELLRDALYTEEVTREPEAAAKQYQELLSRHDAQRAFAASALFRLAEVRRKQDRKDEAIALYQKLLTRFPEAEAEGKLAREHLAALGGMPAEGDQTREMSPAEKNLRNQQEVIDHLKALAEDSPDMLKEQLNPAIQSDQPLVVEYLLSKGVDPGTPGALGTAANLGKLSICKLLLQKGKPSPEEAGKAMAEAIRAGRMTILSYLLEQGLDPQSPVSWSSGVSITPLWVAVEAGSLEAAKVLLDRGADIDFIVHPTGDPGKSELTGTALHYAVQKERGLPMVRLLLERGAKPDLPTPVGGLTPLHFAAIQDFADSSAMVSGLLAKGADPNRRSTLRLEENAQWILDPLERATPFEAALQKNSPAKIRMMLEKGADLKAPDFRGWLPLSHAIVANSPDLARELIAAGADLNGRSSSGRPFLLTAVIAAVDSEGVGRSPDDHEKARARHLEMVKVLLDAGADPSAGHQGKTPLNETVGKKHLQSIYELLLAKGAKPDTGALQTIVVAGKWDEALKMLEAGAPLPSAATAFPWETPLVLAMRSADALPVIEKMIEKGAKPEDAWIQSGFSISHYSGKRIKIARPVRALLFQRFILPGIEERAGIRMIVHGDGETKTTVLDDPSPPLEPRPLAQSLLDPVEPFSHGWRVLPGDRVTLWRKSGGRWTAVETFPLDRKEDLPVLQRGDMLELADGPGPESLRSQPTGGSVLAPEMQWSLRRRVSFPVTVELDGKTREVMLRGDRLVFDPAVPGVVPWGGARKIMQLLWQPEIDFQGFEPTVPQTVLEKVEVVVRRAGWPDIRLPFRSSGKDFPLRVGDRISLEVPEIDPKHVALRRKDRVTVRSADAPFVRHFGDYTFNPESPDPRTLPSLLQAVAEVTQFHRLQDAPRDPAALPAWLIGEDFQLAYFQRPDLSKIRLRRLQQDGSEKIIDVDLAKIIAATPEDATIEEVRKADMTLLGGDIVEIPVLPADKAKPWAGLTAAEDAFFSKALSCRVQVTDSAGNIRVREIRYRAPRVAATEAGPIPLPVPESVPSLLGAVSFGSFSSPIVTRGGLEETGIDPWKLFLREGDRLVYPAPVIQTLPTSPQQRPAPGRNR